MMAKQNFNKRHSPNRRKTRVGALMDIDGVQVPVIIADVSYDGMKLLVPAPMATGTPITLIVLGSEIPAIVHWSKKRVAGVHLLTRLDVKTLRELETAHDVLSEYR